MNIKSIALILSVVVFTINGSAQSFSDTLNQELTQLFNESTFTGVAVAIYNSDEVLYKYALGFADIENHIPYATSHIQNIGSVSKTFIAAALMKAVESGKITLDDPINDHLSFKVIILNLLTTLLK